MDVAPEFHLWRQLISLFPDKLFGVGIHIAGWQYSPWIWSNANHFDSFVDFVPTMKNSCRKNNNENFIEVLDELDAVKAALEIQRHSPSGCSSGALRKRRSE